MCYLSKKTKLAHCSAGDAKLRIPPRCRGEWELISPTPAAPAAALESEQPPATSAPRAPRPLGRRTAHQGGRGPAARPRAPSSVRAAAAAPAPRAPPPALPPRPGQDPDSSPSSLSSPAGDPAARRPAHLPRPLARRRLSRPALPASPQGRARRRPAPDSTERAQKVRCCAPAPPGGPASIVGKCAKARLALCVLPV